MSEKQIADVTYIVEEIIIQNKQVAKQNEKSYTDKYKASRMAYKWNMDRKATVRIYEVALNGDKRIIWENGMWVVGEELIDLHEFRKLAELCDKAGFKYEIGDLYGGKQLVVYDRDTRICDAVIHEFSYGHQEAQLEFMYESEVIGFLDADTCLIMIRGALAKYHSEHRKVGKKEDLFTVLNEAANKFAHN